MLAFLSPYVICEFLIVALLTIKSSVMWRCVAECVVPDFSKDGAAFFYGDVSKNNFSLSCLVLEMKAPRSYEMSEPLTH